jgi:RecA/RadA recombinase
VNKIAALQVAMFRRLAETIGGTTVALINLVLLAGTHRVDLTGTEEAAVRHATAAGHFANKVLDSAGASFRSALQGMKF